MTDFTPPQPYTLAQHAQRCRNAAEHGETLVQYVQLRRQETTWCGVVVGAWVAPNGEQLHALELLAPYPVRHTCAPAHRLTQCSGLDGRCLCAGETTPATRSATELATALQAASGVLGDMRC